MTMVQAAAALSLLTATATQEGSSAEAAAQQARANIGQMTLGYTYYNRPGATREHHAQEVKACVLEAARVRTADELSTMPAGLLGSLIKEGLSNAFHAGAVGAALENCMVYRGWRVVRLTDAEGTTIAAMSQEQAGDAIAPWIGAVLPKGEIVRVWTNEAGRGSTRRIVVRPDYTDDGPLSLKAVSGQTLRQVEYADGSLLQRGKLAKGWSTRRVKPGKFAERQPGAAVLIANVKGIGGHAGISVTFERVGSDPNVAPSTVDHLPDRAEFMGSFLKDGEWFAYVIPEGTWRIARISWFPWLSLCYGSPAIEVKPGEILYAGSFDLKADQLGPDLSLEPVQRYLTKHGASAEVRAVSYVNGWPGRCEGSQFYGLEVEGAPHRAESR